MDAIRISLFLREKISDVISVTRLSLPLLQISAEDVEVQLRWHQIEPMSSHSKSLFVIPQAASRLTPLDTVQPANWSGLVWSGHIEFYHISHFLENCGIRWLNKFDSKLTEIRFLQLTF